MNTIKISTEDKFYYNGDKEAPMVIKTNGLKYSKATETGKLPVLYNHKDIILGYCSEMRIENNVLLADVEFDDDAEAVKYQKKFNKGSLNGVSPRLDVGDVAIIDGVLTILEAEIVEVSLTPIPQNYNAARLEFSKEGMEDKFNTILLSRKNDIEMDKKEELEPVIEEGKPVELVEPAEALTETVKEEDVETPLSVELSLENEELKKELADKTVLLDELSKKVEMLIKDKEALELSRNIVNEDVNLIKNEMLEKAVKEGKFSKEAVELIKDKSIADLKVLIGGAKVSLSLNDMIHENRKKANTELKPYEWYLKNDTLALSKMQKEQPEMYKKLADEFLKKNKK